MGEGDSYLNMSNVRSLTQGAGTFHPTMFNFWRTIAHFTDVYWLASNYELSAPIFQSQVAGSAPESVVKYRIEITLK